MSEHPRKLALIVNVDGRLSSRLGGNDQGRAWHHDGELDNQFVTSLDATVYADAISSGGLRSANGCVEKFWSAHSLHDAMLVNSHFCPLNLECFHHFQIRTDSKEIRRGDACEHFELTCSARGTSATKGRGIPLAALVHATGASRNHHNSIHAKAIASATPHPKASKNLALSDIQNSFGFAPRRTHSLKSRLQTSAPTVVASNSVARPSFADADREGV